MDDYNAEKTLFNGKDFISLQAHFKSGKLDGSTTIILPSRNHEDPSKSLGLRLYYDSHFLEYSITLMDALKFKDDENKEKFIKEIIDWLYSLTGVTTVVTFSKNKWEACHLTHQNMKKKFKKRMTDLVLKNIKKKEKIPDPILSQSDIGTKLMEGR